MSTLDPKPKDTQPEEGRKISGHNYDGIEELDHSLPRWWINLFYLTIIFAVGYYFYYELGGGPSLNQEYLAAKSEYSYSQLSQKTAVKTATEDELRSFLKAPERIASGRAIFQARCLACHGAAGQGGIGPNLTDDYWVHGGKMTAILNTITNGVLDKGMPPWGPILKQDELYSVATFVKSLRGSNPPGAKAPQGELEKE